MNNKKNIEKTCCFYVSEAHFAVMILPYIKKEIENNKNITTFFEHGIEEVVELLVSRINLQENIKQKIKNINWSSRKVLKYLDIENILIQNNNDIILIYGKEDYIENINKIIKKYLSNKKQKIKIINCYDLNEISKSTKEILKKHDNILNTAGEKKIEEIFAINQ